MAKRSTPADLFGGRAPALIPEALGGTREKQLVFGASLDPRERARREAAAERERESERLRAERAETIGSAPDPRLQYMSAAHAARTKAAWEKRHAATVPRIAQPALGLAPDEPARERRRAAMGATAAPADFGPLFGKR